MNSTEHAAARFATLESWPTGDLATALLETQLAAVAAAAGRKTRWAGRSTPPPNGWRAADG